MIGNATTLRSICRVVSPMASEPSTEALEAIDQLMLKTIELLAKGASDADVVTWYIRAIHDQVARDGIDPESLAYETRIAIAQRTIFACLVVAEGALEP
jgi:hypothetical protein